MDKSIPEIKFKEEQQSIEFEIFDNFELLFRNSLSRHNLFQPHRINFYAILYIIKGEGQHYIDFKSYNYQRGTIIFISKEQVHRFVKNPDRQAFFIIFTEGFLERSSMGSALMQKLSLYNYHFHHPVLQLQDGQMHVFTELIRRSREEYKIFKDELTAEIMQSVLRIFLLMAERVRKSTNPNPVVGKYQTDFLQFHNLLQKHLLQERKVKFYADTMNISPKTLNRLCHEVVKQPVKSYINDMLILEIKRLLTNTSLSIKEIAFKSGFQEPTNFVKFFKKSVKLTPAGFRKQFQQG